MAVPYTKPDATPVVAPIDNIVVLLLLHVPPVVVVEYVTGAARQTDVGPVTAAGTGFTVTTLLTKQPSGKT
jgi:hypothetical protein